MDENLWMIWRKAKFEQTNICFLGGVKYYLNQTGNFANPKIVKGCLAWKTNHHC
jgi:hypothetical protein